MKNKLTILFILICGLTYSQKNYLNFNTMLDSQYIGIGWERSYLMRTISHEVSIGLLGGSMAIRLYKRGDVYNTYFGCTHFVQFIPSVSGWKTFPHIGISKERGNSRIGIELGPRLQWWDRKSILDLGIGLKFSKIF